MGVIKAMLQNNITDRGVIFNIGIICFVLLCVLLVTSIVSKSDESWKKYILGAGIIYMLTLNIIPLPTSLPQTAIGIIQFTGRLLSIVMVLLVMGCVLFLKVNSNRVNVKSSLIFLL